MATTHAFLGVCVCGSKLHRRGKPQVLVHVSTDQGSILVPVFEPQPCVCVCVLLLGVLWLCDVQFFRAR